ncbi:MAG: homoserine kinase [Pseudanabaena sp.]|jgi:homoserine kinase|uniref:homoserine kinase n=1 Tax=Pseudanabaena mucicola TaxID=71190 RepID=UPI002576D59F|nr:homoserine kinase [Pseudanabaena mucicola]MCA6572376.1 homoserine kinase [Pseudanabaena sp. M53BS1SP1A06MG]MCA6580550.1 homoserine kinase [Pseudanabaena sp. M34BS1SP1A06MG]MCA6586503.1 homoserine kinase [Pseudanabaena sp. M051S1SP1A06QC]MCA6589109.1 homoserine kinase [Pseudanabaena sp. M109S1SP1A06QC]MCA6591832.1 homoserine kinase [Pseudanabaena sp. M38BS1SP1A06MG]MCA6598138.1 homoserine kinase [Pseudanabaena sp. M046S1SP1A06QC]MCA6601364.1 homoserine kinase [Pseudanabaena sp. M57BS1SP1A0
MTIFEVSVPATTANIGPGFDCLGAALKLYNHFEFSLADLLTITASGEGADKVERDETNLVYQAIAKFYQHIDRPIPPIAFHTNTMIPLSRGLGSSATAIVGGIVGANLLAGSPLDRLELLDLAIAMEGHPDNVAPAMLGGCQLMASNQAGGWEYCDLHWHESIGLVVAIPDFELSTAKAREVLPKKFSMHDAVFNASHLALLSHGIQTGNVSWLKAGLQDRLHQNYRQSLITGMAEVQAAAIAAGAYGLVISGAGPTLLSLAPMGTIEVVAQAMNHAWQAIGVNAMTKCLAIAKDGTTFKTR